MPVARRGNYGSSTADLTKPALLSDGDLLVVFTQRNSSTAPTMPAGFTTLLTKVAADNSSSVRVGYKQVATAASEPATYTFTNATAIIAVVAYQHHPTDPFYYSDSQALSSTAVTFASGGFTLNSDEFLTFMLVSAAVTTGVNSTSAPTNWTHYRFQARMKAALYDMPAATYSNIAYTYGTTAQQLVGALFVIRPVILPSLATVTSNLQVPNVINRIKTISPLMTSTSSALIPTTKTGAIVSIPALAASAAMPVPVVRVAAIVAAQVATASAAAYPALMAFLVFIAAPTFTATATAYSPVAVLSLTVPLMTVSATALLPTATVAASALAVAMTATSLAYPAIAIQSISAPLMAVSASAFAVTALGSAILAALPGVASSSAVTPDVGIDRRAGSFRGNYASISLAPLTGSATIRPRTTMTGAPALPAATATQEETPS